MLAATVPWTYWMVFPLFGAVVLAAIAVLIGYYRKILVPTYELWVHQMLSSDGAQASPPALRLVDGGIEAGQDQTQLRRAA